ncbi:ATP-dependent protease La [Treponema sp. JC4]|uniref:endopeptidase La n=1 Tax=Treponema sp. JC4 TaxID=1124982 RepID=UPI00025B0304|nr:endopeptidase La [Treponema sp. JC4]EID84776.1 ATP-dependent protease La [Treponema sp. JC4]
MANKEDNSIIPTDQILPNKLTLIPLQGRPVFPGIFTPLMISSNDDVKVAESAFEKDGFVGIVMLKNDAENPTVADLHRVGTVARIIKKINLPDGGINIFVSTIKRFKIRKTLHSQAPMAAAVEYLEEEENDTFEVKALTRALISEMKEVSENNPLFSDEMRLNMVNIDNPGKIADFIASILNTDKDDQQKILETVNVRQRMEQVLVFIKREQELLRVQKKISQDINERVDKNQREYFLREELKAIQDELGETAEGNATDYQKFKTKIDELKFEGEIKETVESELEKFKLMDPNSSEFIGTRNFLELVVNLPWHEEIKEDYDLGRAKKILENDHFGLDDVKKRILEYLAVRKMKKDAKGSIMLLVGPPGVGKTSVGKSIANAMNKPFYRFSVGGMRDEAEIKGHRRTYIGAMPGKIIQGLKITKSASPVFLIDEVDKMGSSHNGDPASALLEVLDPEQNVNFRDNYLDLPFDVSNVFFILTANTLDSIPGPLLDRAEVIQLSGYIDQEKLEIAKKYLIPKNLSKNGLKKNQVKYTKDALLTIAEEYARESGVRNYEKSLDKIHRKIVTELITQSELKKSEFTIADDLSEEEKAKLTGERDAAVQAVLDTPYTVDSGDLFKYLGKPVFDESEIKAAKVPGTAIGLAWTSMGGDTLLIESTYFAGKGGLVLTGQMGDVMKESSQIAFNWARKFVLDRKAKKADWFDKNIIHLHIPEGATPKDGPSAGITMATTFVSLLMNKKIKPNLAMTGELSLTGQVLPIGGLREKTVAAKRNKIKTIIIPKANERDLEEIPENVKKGIKFIPVSDVHEVLEAALGIK